MIPWLGHLGPSRGVLGSVPVSQEAPPLTASVLGLLLKLLGFVFEVFELRFFFKKEVLNSICVYKELRSYPLPVPYSNSSCILQV